MDFIKHFENHLLLLNIKKTPERMIVANLIDKMPDIFLLEDLFKKSSSLKQKVSRGTIFNVLKLMKKASLLVNTKEKGVAKYYKKEPTENLVFIQCCDKMIKIKSNSSMAAEIEKLCICNGLSNHGWIVNIQAVELDA